MEELEQILREHANRYPLMQPIDAVKLIYQNEFGGGHLIRDEQAVLNYLRREYESVEKDSTMPLYEDIGNGIVRVNLAAVKPKELDQLGLAFVQSAAEHNGTLEHFQKKLELLLQMTRNGVFSFSATELEDYLEMYAAESYPMVSHCQVYRDHYKPAYRIILLAEDQRK